MHKSTINTGKAMKTIEEQLSTYKSVHLNKSNVKTHFVGVPLIIWAVSLLLATVTFEVDLYNGQMFTVTMMSVIAAILVVYYLVLDARIALVAIAFFGPIIYSVNFVVGHEHVLIIAISVFVVGWIIQFLGHHFEKAKPAFVDDLNQLAIGPLFLAAEVYFWLGLDRSLDDQVTRLAIDKRKAFEQGR